MKYNIEISYVYNEVPSVQDDETQIGNLKTVAVFSEAILSR